MVRQVLTLLVHKPRSKRTREINIPNSRKFKALLFGNLLSSAKGPKGGGRTSFGVTLTDSHEFCMVGILKNRMHRKYARVPWKKELLVNLWIHIEIFAIFSTFKSISESRKSTIDDCSYETYQSTIQNQVGKVILGFF